MPQYDKSYAAPFSLLVLFAWTLAWSQTAWSAGPEIRIAPGASSFVFVDEQSDPSK